MKNFYTLVGALLIASGGYAQEAKIADFTKTKHAVSISTPENTPISSSAASAAVLWEDDFSTPSNWTLTNTSNPANDWYFSTDPTEIPVGDLSPFESTSADNGFLMINSDALGTGASSDGDGNFLSVEATTSSVIDLSGYPNVRLSFEHNFRWWHDTRGVRVSGDNGATWTEYELTNVDDYADGDFEFEQNSNNPHITTIDISAEAGNSSEVLVQFYYDDNDIWAWYWAVDDVKISETPDNEINLYSAQPYLYGANFYTQIPESQINGDSVFFVGAISNTGMNDQTEVKITAEVMKNGVSDFTSSSASGYTLVTNSSDTLVAEDAYIRDAVGSYDYTITASSSEFGNTETYQFSNEVTASTYALDEGTPEGYWRLGRNDGCSMSLCNAFEFYNNATGASISARLADYTEPDAQVFYTIYKYVDSDWSWEEGTQGFGEYTITAADTTSKWIDLDFVTNYEFEAGSFYNICVGGVGHDTDTVGISVSGNADGSLSYILDTDNCFGEANPPANGFWTVSAAPMVRLNLSDGNSIEENNSSSFTIYPNPNNGEFEMSINSKETTNFDVSVTNVLGQVVLEEELKNVNTINKSINLRDMKAGVYFITLSNKLTSSTKQIVIK